MHRFTRFAAAATIVLALSTGCQSAASQDQDVQAIKNDVARWQADFNARDLEKLLSHYAPDAVVVVPGVPIAKSEDARRAVIKDMIADPAFALTSFDCPKVEVAKSRDLAFAQCTYTMILTDSATKKVIHDKGSVIEVYKKQPGGQWKSVSDTAASEIPSSPVSPTASSQNR